MASCTCASREISVDRLPSLIRAYQQKNAKSEFDAFGSGLQEFSSHGLLFRRIESLAAIELDQVVVGRDYETPGDSGPHQDFIGEMGPQTKQMFCSWQTLVDLESPVESKFELAVHGGWLVHASWNEGRWFAGFHIGSASKGFQEIEYRHFLVERILVAMGLDGGIKTEFNQGHFTISSQEPWQLRFIHAGLGGQDALGIWFGGFSDYAHVLRAARGALQHVSTKIYECKIAARCDASQFESIRGPLNALAHDWRVEPLGEYTPRAAAILAGESADFGEISVIPAAEWIEKRKGAKEIFQLNVRPAGRGCVLEVISDCADVDRLMDRAQIPADLGFTLVAK